MKKIFILTMTIMGLFFASSSFATITGPHTVCVGSTISLIDSPITSGTWSSSMPTIASIGVSTGVVTGVSAGTAMITYWGATTGVSTTVITVNMVPATITGTASICLSGTTTLTCGTSGGTWSSMATSVATIGSASGLVSSVSVGTATIRYTLSTGCYAARVVTVSAGFSDSVIGGASVCLSGTLSLTSTLGGGTWTSSNPSIATVGSSGVVTGVALGTAIITHAATTGCGVASATHMVTVISSTSAGTISGPTTVAMLSSITLSSSISGGTWSCSCTGVATVGATTGIVMGSGAGTCVITYTYTGCGTAISTYTVTVTVPNCITGTVNFYGAPYYGPVRVWLIKYNPTTHILSACDSNVVYCTSGTNVNYTFCGMAADSFRVKAACDSSTPIVGYLPTYHTNSAYWNTATVIVHASGAYDINKNINMNWGTPSSGPGFIAGDVTTGANKGTADGAPVANMLVYCRRYFGGQILQYTYTDAAGHYSFSNLPLGEAYEIYPEDINYATTPYPPITLTSAADTITYAKFIQHTISMTITPIPQAIINTNPNIAGISVYPNPTSGSLNVEWNVADAGTGDVSITDVTGRVVFTNIIDMGHTQGKTHLDLSTIGAGLYMINIKANGVNYNSKLMIQ